jgi:peptidoglycan/LPS O-acetylase OafA/YrhL
MASGQSIVSQEPANENSTAQLSENSPNLDFLRAFAVMLVVAGHLGEYFGIESLGPVYLGGFLGTLGVLIFFVHTCYVLMMSLERQAASIGKRIFMPFMIRRSFRIYPLSMLAILLIAVFHLPQAIILHRHFIGWKFDGGDLFSNLFLVQNFSFRVPILGPTWSLCYEMEMYLFLPMLFVALRSCPSWWYSMCLYAASVLACIGILHFSSTPNLALYVPCFLPGVLAYELRKARPAMRKWIPSWIWPGAIISVSTLYLLSPTSRAKAWLFCLLLGFAIPSFAQLSMKWIVSPSKYVAKYSYGIYLSHFFAIWFAFERLQSLPFGARVVVFVVIGAGIPVAAYHLVERPMIDVGKSVAARYTIILNEREAPKKRAPVPA